MHRFRYHPFYCEENAWWLCADPDLAPAPRFAVFIGSARGHCPFLNQRAAAPGALCWWDYHCVVLDGDGQIWDPDTRLGLPVPAMAWITGSFPFLGRLPEPLLPRFRVVPGADYLREFASDRGHMRDHRGRWRQPPPPWPAIGQGMTLPDYTNLTRPGPGRLLDLPGFVTWTARLGQAAGPALGGEVRSGDGSHRDAVREGAAARRHPRSIST